MKKKDRALTRFALTTMLDETISFVRAFGYGHPAIEMVGKLQAMKQQVEDQWANRASRARGSRREARPRSR